MKNILAGLCLLFLLNSCTKEQDPVADPLDPTATAAFVTYNIFPGNHSSDKSSIQKINLSAQHFSVIFDSSAIYTTQDPQNQGDINKLYGFTEGYDPHYNSARIGWAFYKNQLRLYGYVYNDKKRISEEISTVKIGETIKCSIKVEEGNYVFTVNGHSLKLPRTAKTAQADGYQLYPYFGGDETAPHHIRIRIKPER
jgi:hypothetical protein